MLGYNIFRNLNDDLPSAIKINATLIGAVNSSTTQNYSYVDPEAEPNATNYYWLQSVELDGSICYWGPVSLYLNLDGGDTPPPPVRIFGINNFYPNPFNPSATLSFCLDEGGAAKITVYNIKGQPVRIHGLGNLPGRIVQQFVIEGKDENGRDLPSGVYFLRLSAPGIHEMKRIVLSK